MRRLSQAGFKRGFLRPAILPDWWDETCLKDPSLLPDIEIRVARFLGVSISTIRNPDIPLAAPHYAGAQLRRVRDLDRDRLAPAIHSALQIATAVVRSLGATFPSPIPLPSSGLEWRVQIAHAGPSVQLSDILGDLWMRGIAVVALDILPTPNFQGLACVVEGRPVIVLGHKHDELGRVAFFVAHEAGHIAAGDCTPDHPVVDEEEEIADDTEMELNADRYATHLLVGSDDIPELDAEHAQDLATQAGKIEEERGVDASAVIYAWARRTGDYAKARMAVNALYLAQGARRLLREHFDRHVDLGEASESDRALLRCIFGEPERDAIAN